MMEKGTFTPQLSKAEALKLAQQHETSAEGKKALEAGDAITGGDLSVAHLRTIYRWKTGDRGKSTPGLQVSRIERRRDQQTMVAVADKYASARVNVAVETMGAGQPQEGWAPPRKGIKCRGRIWERRFTGRPRAIPRTLPAAHERLRGHARSGPPLSLQLAATTSARFRRPCDKFRPRTTFPWFFLPPSSLRRRSAKRH